MFDAFLKLVEENLVKNGFPAKSVTFPLDKMFEEADKRGFSFNRVRDELDKKQIFSTLVEDKVLFTATKSVANQAIRQPDDLSTSATRSQTANTQSDLNDESYLLKLAEQMLGNMSAEQRAAIEETMSKISPKEMAALQEQWQQMSQDEKQKVAHLMQKS